MANTDSTTSRNYAISDPDVRLMIQVRDADSAAAFEELVLRYQDRVVMLLEHFVNHRDSAEECAQEVFLRIYRARKNYHPSSKFSTWLYAIANNVASNARRSKVRRKEINWNNPVGNSSAAISFESLATAASGQTPPRCAARTEVTQVVREAINLLNERQRMALLLAKFEHMSYEDVALTMDLSPKAVKSLLARARVNLRELLKPFVAERDKPPTD